MVKRVIDRVDYGAAGNDIAERSARAGVIHLNAKASSAFKDRLCVKLEFHPASVLEFCAKSGWQIDLGQVWNKNDSERLGDPISKLTRWPL